MKQFVVKIFLLSIFIVISHGALIWIIPANPVPSDYLAAIIDKHKILEATPSPKIILVGGSNVAFGLDSKKIQDELALPVVNMGLHGGFGLRYMIEEIKPQLKPGDIVILIPEYQQFYQPYGSDVLIPLIKYYPNAIRHLSLKNYMIIVRYIPLYIKNRLKLGIETGFTRFFPEFPPNHVYSRYGFNQYGDVINHLNKDKDPVKFKLTKQSLNNLRSEGVPEDIVEALKPMKWREFEKFEFLEAVEKHISREYTVKYQKQILKYAEKSSAEIEANRKFNANLEEIVNRKDPSKSHNDGIAFLNDFSIFTKQHNVKVFLSFPAIPDIYYHNKVRFFEKCYSQLLSNLTMPILGSIEEYVFPVKYFFDTVYHLNADGRRIRTEQVIGDISKALELKR